MKRERGMTLAYAAIVAGVVALVMAYFTSNEVNNAVEVQQDKLAATQVEHRDDQVRACVRGSIARQEKFTYSMDEESNAIYMAGQESDGEIRHGWKMKVAYEQERQIEIKAEADRIGFRYPGTVMNDCEQVVGS